MASCSRAWLVTNSLHFYIIEPVTQLFPSVMHRSDFLCAYLLPEHRNLKGYLNYLLFQSLSSVHHLCIPCSPAVHTYFRRSFKYEGIFMFWRRKEFFAYTDHFDLTTGHIMLVAAHKICK